MIPMPRATSNGIEIEYETFGALAAPPLLLIAGLGSQMLSWDDDFCALLASRGFRVIRYDNRVQPTAEGSAVLMAPAPPTREERIALGLWAKQKLLGPADPFDEPYERARITRAVDRAYHPAGFGRQLGAILVARGRLERLGAVGVPTLVIHGDADLLVPVENGRRVAAAVPGARLME